MMDQLCVYHEGERMVQLRLGEVAIAKQNGRVIADGVMPTAIQFIAQQPALVIGSMDEVDQPWASILFGTPGFSTADERYLYIDRMMMWENQSDIFWRNIQTNQNIGTQVIELSSRRRVRLNGKVISIDQELVVIDVECSYPNCPKYIQRRQTPFHGDLTESKIEIIATGEVIGKQQQSLITDSDTMFVASCHQSAGVDVSHRGGNPGFMKVLDEERIRIADYPGNSMYNTLGNFEMNPVAGIVIPDFTNGSMLQLTGRIKVHWELDDEKMQSGGTNRYWDIRIEKWIQTKYAVPTNWELLEASPFNW